MAKIINRAPYPEPVEPGDYYVKRKGYETAEICKVVVSRTKKVLLIPGVVSEIHFSHVDKWYGPVPRVNPLPPRYEPPTDRK